MTYTLTIELGNDAMQSFADLRAALKQASGKLGAVSCCATGKPSVGDGSKLRDENGNTVGEWVISA